MTRPPSRTRNTFTASLAWRCPGRCLVIARDPVRFRPLIIPAVLEKATFGGAVVMLFAQERASFVLLAFGIVDLVWGLLFLAAFVQLRPKPT